jgi:hypothetical protein
MPTQALTLPRQQRSRLEFLWRQKVDQVVARSLELYEAAPPVEFMPDWRDDAVCRDRRVARLRARVLRAHEELAEIEAAIKASDQAGHASQPLHEDSMSGAYGPQRASGGPDAPETAGCRLIRAGAEMEY